MSTGISGLSLERFECSKSSENFKLLAYFQLACCKVYCDIGFLLSGDFPPNTYVF